MAPTILVIGATGNTGQSVVETLPKLLGSTSLSAFKVLALTRDSSTPKAQQLARHPVVQLVEKNWTEVTEDWLREHEVIRVFIASHTQPDQFADEGQFLVNALRAAVKYVVRISTTAANVHPACPAYHARTHWEIEAMLDQSEFSSMHFSSLRPNAFTTMFLAGAVNFAKDVVKSGKQDGPLRLLLDRDTAIALIDPSEVGIFAAHLLAQEETAQHAGKRYVLNGPEDITGAQVVRMVESYTGQPVNDVRFRDESVFDDFTANSPWSRNLMQSIKNALRPAWDAQAVVQKTSQEVLDLHAPKRSATEAFEEMLAEH